MMLNIVTVIGANGAMGCKMSGIFASFGRAKVYLVCRKQEDAEKAVELAVSSVRADSIRSKLIPTTYENLSNCLAESDFVFESITEDLEAKIQINKLINKYVKNDTIIGTGTSGLSINQLADCFDDLKKKNYLGLHFFNPPYAMTLVEIIKSKFTEEKNIHFLKNYLENILFRNVIEVKDEPAFLANRIGFQFINEALQMAEQYKDSGGIDYIDSILGCFTGRNISPIRTADFVGLDVHKAIVDNVFNKTDDIIRNSFQLPSYVENLIKEGKLGKKVNEGLYKTIIHDDGIKEYFVYDINQNNYRKVEKYNFSFARQMVNYLEEGDYDLAINVLKNNHSKEANICLMFLLKYIWYAIFITKKIASNIEAVDIAMATGFNWIPPLALIDAFGGKSEVIKLFNEYYSQEFIQENVVNIFLDLPKSKYDYRIYLKAKM